MESRATWWTVRPYWKRVPPWWWTAVIALGPVIRIALGPSNAWFTVADGALLLLAAVYIVLDLRRLRGSGEVE